MPDKTTADTQFPDPKQFETNFRKLETLAADLEKGAISIDELIPRAQEGAEAAKQCLGVLAKSEATLTEIDRVFTAITSDCH